MKKFKDLKTGDYLYFYRDNDYFIEDVEKCLIDNVYKDKTHCYVSFKWGFMGVNLDVKENEGIMKLEEGEGHEHYKFYTEPPTEEVLRANRNKRIKELKEELSKLIDKC